MADFGQSAKFFLAALEGQKAESESFFRQELMARERRFGGAGVTGAAADARIRLLKAAARPCIHWLPNEED
jgi:hypothetical protein